jgi:hypothetical protein
MPGRELSITAIVGDADSWDFFAPDLMLLCKRLGSVARVLTQRFVAAPHQGEKSRTSREVLMPRARYGRTTKETNDLKARIAMFRALDALRRYSAWLWAEGIEFPGRG